MVRGGSGAVVPERHQLPQVRPIANDLRVSLDIGHGGRVVSELAEVGQPAGFWKVFDRFRHRHDVKRGVLRGQLADGGENQPMLMPEEVLLLQLIADNVPCRVVQHQAAEYPCSASTECGGVSSRTLTSSPPG